MAFTGAVTFCYTADLSATAAFYEETLGLELALDQGACRIYRVTDTAFLGFCTREEAPRPDGVILCLLTPDVESTCATLSERGVTFEKPPQPNPSFRIFHAFLRDPNGYLLEIQRFEDPAWQGP